AVPDRFINKIIYPTLAQAKLASLNTHELARGYLFKLKSIWSAVMLQKLSLASKEKVKNSIH
ncbi:MAG: hypothetical protein WBQ62_03900, partial [Dehalococcoidales bacterium]